jgi:hypothetical protein
MYRLFSLSLFPKQYSITTIFVAFTRYEVLYNDLRYRERLHTLNTNSTSSIRGLSILRFWYSQQPWSQSPSDTKGHRS